MIRVLIMANESLLAQFIESALSQEPDLELFRMTRAELGLRRDCSVVIVIDYGMSESESIKLKEVIRDDVKRLFIRVSVASKIVYVDESYQLNNPGLEQLVALIRDFSSKILPARSQDDTDWLKKMNSLIQVQAGKQERLQTYYPFGRLFALTQARGFHDHLAGDAGGSSHKEMPFFFCSFFPSVLKTEKSGKRDAASLAEIFDRTQRMTMR